MQTYDHHFLEDPFRESYCCNGRHLRSTLGACYGGRKRATKLVPICMVISGSMSCP